MRQRVVHFLVTIESLAALGGIIIGGAGVSTWLVVPEVVWVAIICAIPVVLGFVPWCLRLRASRQRRRQVPPTATEAARQRAIEADADFRRFMYDLSAAITRGVTPAAYREHETKKEPPPDA